MVLNVTHWFVSSTALLKGGVCTLLEALFTTHHMILHNWGCCYGNTRTPPLPYQPDFGHTHVYMHTYTHFFGLTGPHDLTSMAFHATNKTASLWWLEILLPKRYLTVTRRRNIFPLWWLTAVLFDKQIKHSPHFTTCAGTVLLFMAFNQSTANRTKKRKEKVM